jgi:hypothetical protein
MHATDWKKVVKITTDLILLLKESIILNRKEQKKKHTHTQSANHYHRCGDEKLLVSEP